MRRDNIEEEVVEKISRFVADEFKGDFAAAFAEYDKNDDSQISMTELKLFLADAGVGSRLTREMYVLGVMKHVDGDDDRRISLAELRSKIEGGK